jgi:hypothetical protein
VWRVQPGGTGGQGRVRACGGGRRQGGGEGRRRNVPGGAAGRPPLAQTERRNKARTFASSVFRRENASEANSDAIQRSRPLNPPTGKLAARGEGLGIGSQFYSPILSTTKH